MKTALVCLVAILTQDPLSYVLSAGRSFHSFTVHNHILVGHVFRVIPKTDWLSCLLACQDEPRCVSYNFQKVSFGKEACQLSEYGVQECCEGESLIFAEDCVFHQLKSFQVGNGRGVLRYRTVAVWCGVVWCVCVCVWCVECVRV